MKYKLRVFKFNGSWWLMARNGEMFECGTWEYAVVQLNKFCKIVKTVEEICDSSPSR